MKKTLLLFVLIAFTSSLMFMGFQCGSAEMTSAKLYLQRSEWDNAKIQLEKETSKHPENAEAWFMLGRVHFEQKNYKEMLDAFNASLKVSNQYQKDISNFRLSAWGSNLNKGVDFYNKGIQNPDSSTYFNEAIGCLQTAIMLVPDSALSYRVIALSYYGIKDKDNAVVYMKKALERQNDLQIGRMLGGIYYARAMVAKNNAAIITIAQNIKIGISENDIVGSLGSPDQKVQTVFNNVNATSYHYNNLGIVIYCSDNKVIGFTFDVKGAEKMKIREIEIANENLNEAIKVYQNTLKLAPNDPNILAGLNDSFISAGRTQEALDSYKTAIIADPNNKLVHYNYGVLLLRAKDFPEAATQFEEALKIDDKFTDALYNVSATYMQWGAVVKEEAEKAVAGDKNKMLDKSFEEKFTKAKGYLERLLALAPDDIGGWETLGMANAILNLPKEAKAAYDKADNLRKNK